MRNLILSIAIFASISLSAQKVLRYEGSYANNKNEAATANYSYYKDAKTGKKVKHGSFRYLVKIKSPQKRLYRNITGEYIDGWKNGSWNYSYTTKDYNTNNDGYFYSYNVVLEAKYDHGWPDGEWNYTAFVKRRKPIRSSSGNKWEAYEIIQNIRIKLNYNHGVLVDSLWIRNDQGANVFANMDKYGFLQGDFTLERADRKMTFAFIEGFKIQKGKTDDVGKLHYDYYKKNKAQLKNSGARLDTVSLFDRSSCIISKVLNQQVFNPDYFNYQYIDGDRIINFLGSRKTIVVDYKGLYKRKLSIVISKDEETKIRSIYGFYNRAKQQTAKCNKLYQSSNHNDDLRQKLVRLKNIEQKLSAYSCQVGEYKTNLTPQELISATKSCNSDIKISAGHTRLQILNTIYNKGKALDNALKKTKCN